MSEASHTPGSSPHDPARPGIRTLTFGDDLAFQTELRRRVDEYFAVPGRCRRDCPQMYVKTAIVLTSFVASYVLLVFVARNLWQGLLCSVLLAVSTAAIGFDIQHDGGHQSYSSRRWLNRLAAWMLDVVGSSSGRWHWKHSVIHHKFVNITGYDGDIHIEPLGRFTPYQRRFWWHRWQHLYLWVFYAMLALEMQLLDDFHYVITGRLGGHRVPRPAGRELLLFLAGKAVFVTWAMVIPLLLHPFRVWLFYYLLTSLVLGAFMVLVFIVPHLVEKAAFPMPRDDTGRMENPWAVHQAMVTVNFALGNRAVTWLLGGLNYHKEHHLFPVICHVNYPGMAPLVEETCRKFGIPYHTHRSFLAGIAAHYRWLRKMGRGE